jgi:hypothetical protein
MCEQVTKEILFAQGAFETEQSDCDNPFSSTYFWQHSTHAGVLEFGTGNALYVELRCYDGIDYVLETIVTIDGITEFNSAQVLMCGSRYQHIRRAIQIFDEYFESHPARLAHEQA